FMVAACRDVASSCPGRTLLHMNQPRSPRVALAVAACAVLLTVSGCGNSPTSTGAADPPGHHHKHSHSTKTPSPTPSPTPTPTNKPEPTGPPMLLDSIAPLSDTTVGVAMPISIVFTDPVKVSARKEVEEHIKLTTSTPVTGAWHWFGSQRVDFRPKTYWK